MKKRYKILIAIPLVIGLGLFLIGYKRFYIVDSYNYRLTVSFNDGDGVASGSGVVRQVIVDPPCLYDCQDVLTTGEAFPIQFKNGTLIFVLMQYARGFAEYGRFPDYMLFHTKDRWKKPYVKFPVETGRLPSIVYFTDLKNPRSVKIVEPDHISEIAGGGTSFTSATVELTEDEPTAGILKYLPWIGEDREYVKSAKERPPIADLKWDISYFLKKDE